MTHAKSTQSRLQCASFKFQTAKVWGARLGEFSSVGGGYFAARILQNRSMLDKAMRNPGLSKQLDCWRILPVTTEASKASCQFGQRSVVFAVRTSKLMEANVLGVLLPGWRTFWSERLRNPLPSQQRCHSPGTISLALLLARAEYDTIS